MFPNAPKVIPWVGSRTVKTEHLHLELHEILCLRFQNVSILQGQHTEGKVYNHNRIRIMHTIKLPSCQSNKEFVWCCVYTTRDLLLEESQDVTNHFQHLSNSLGNTDIFISSLKNDDNISERIRSLPKRSHSY